MSPRSTAHASQSKSKSKGKGSARPETFFDLLKEDHEKVKDLFEQIGESEEMDIEEIGDIFSQITQELEMHMEEEESYFYPALEEFEDTHGKALEAALAEFRRRHSRLQILVHCAGIARDAVLWKLEDAAWSEVMRVNLDAAFYLLKGTAPLLRESGDAAVVLVSSINGERGKFGQANYAASKAGLMGLGRTAARELGRFGVRVNLVAPGMILTPMTGSLPEEVRARAAEESALGRLGTPEDVARACLFLVSPLARHVTGQVLRVDGGQLIA